MVRAFLVFGTLSAMLIGIAVYLMFRDLDLQLQRQRLDLGRDEAQHIADAAAALGRGQGGIDFSRLREKQDVLERVINQRIRMRPFVRYVEVRDRFGVRLLFVARDPQPGAPLVFSPERSTTGQRWPASAEEVVTAELRRGTNPEGEVRVGIAEDASLRQIEQLRRRLRMKVTIAAACAIGLLVVGLIYVIYLIRKNRRLEQSRLVAERRSYVGLLASGLAHEIRNPLNAMNMNLQMLEEELHGPDGPDAEGHRELLESTKSEIKRLESVVNNFLTYARPSEPRFESRDLNGVVREVSRFLKADFRQRRVDLNLDLEKLLPTVEIDETQFKQALLNLLVNARQVLRAGGEVIVRSRVGAGGEVIIEVQDNGPGIPDEVRARIFDVFYTGRGGGTGLGLPIARQIVERHGGTIEVDSTQGHGTRFVIRLPRRHEQPGTPGTAAEATT